MCRRRRRRAGRLREIRAAIASIASASSSPARATAADTVASSTFSRVHELARACGSRRRRDRQRGAHGLPHERRVGRREVRHEAARLVAPGPEIVDSLLARGGDRRLELGDLVFGETEARQPELRAHSVPLAGLAQQPREAPHERPRRLVPVLPVRIGGERRQARQLRDDVPVGDAVVAAGRRQQADRVLPAARGDVRENLAQEVDDRRLAEGLHLGRQLAPGPGRRIARRSASSGTSSASGRRCRRARAPSTRARPRTRSRRRSRAPSRPTPCRTRGRRRCSGTRRRRGGRRRAPGTPRGGT